MSKFMTRTRAGIERRRTLRGIAPYTLAVAAMAFGAVTATDVVAQDKPQPVVIRLVADHGPSACPLLACYREGLIGDQCP